MTTVTRMNALKIRNERSTEEYPAEQFTVVAPNGETWGVTIRGFRDRTIEGRFVAESWSWWAVSPNGAGADDHHGREHITRAEAERVARDWFIERDMGSMDPLDVGFDARESKTPVVVPDCGFVRVRMPRSKRHPEGKIVAGRRWAIVHALHQGGFTLA